jgi:methionyl-tRNA synthetase
MRFYVTTPIYYVNDVPHLGNAYTTIAADVLRRYHLIRGDEARMLAGTDEHGLKIEREAKERGMTPIAFVDEMSARFQKAWPQLEIETDDFIRTTEPRHVQFVQELWKKVEATGNLYEGSYEDWYCVGCESFKTEKELLPGNVCAIHLRPVERLKEETYFFRLSNWEKPLLALYEKYPDFIQPASRRNEVISFVSSGLRDLSVSRTSFSWGVPVPGNSKHVMYVWFDALANYLSSLQSNDDLRAFWPPKGKAVHLVGKDILRFHAVYWPAFLLAAGYKEDELPSQIYAHGFLTVDGQKMSKSLRNSVDPLRLAKELGADVLRYHLLRAIAFGQDGDFDHAALLERYNADLGKNLGNLLSRTLGLCGKLPSKEPRTIADFTRPEDIDLANAFKTSIASSKKEWDEIAPHRALEATWDLCSAANLYVDRAAPWAVAKAEDWARLETILAALLGVLEAVSVMIWPVMPNKSNEMRAQLGLDPIATKVGADRWPTAMEPTRKGSLGSATPLFPVFDKPTEKALLEKWMPKAEAPSADKIEPKTAANPVQTTSDSKAITYDDFVSVDLRVGIVKTCERVPKKDKLLKLEVDLGEASLRQIVAGLALSFKPEDLVGRRVIVVANLAPRDFGKGLVSHGMLLATGPSESLTLATVQGDVEAGARLK